MQRIRCERILSLAAVMAMSAQKFVNSISSFPV
jgi:hypothetical protein